jgi:DNA phosphorothioation-dependent restriction protein DptG
MNCKESNDYMMSYFDGNQNDIEHAQFKQHLKSCSCCSRDFESMKEIFCAIESKDSIEPPQDFEVNVMKKINSFEMTRKKRADAVLIFTYSFVTVILTALAVAFMARLNGINIFGLFSTTGESFSSFPDTLFTIVNILNAIYHIAIKIADALLQVLNVLTGTYYFMIGVLLCFFIMLPKVFTGLAKQGGKDKV